MWNSSSHWRQLASSERSELCLKKKAWNMIFTSPRQFNKWSLCNKGVLRSVTFAFSCTVALFSKKTFYKQFNFVKLPIDILRASSRSAISIQPLRLTWCWLIMWVGNTCRFSIERRMMIRILQRSIQVSAVYLAPFISRIPTSMKSKILRVNNCLILKFWDFRPETTTQP